MLCWKNVFINITLDNSASQKLVESYRKYQ